MNIIKRIDLLNNYYKQIVITISNFSNNSQRIEKICNCFSNDNKELIIPSTEDTQLKYSSSQKTKQQLIKTESQEPNLLKSKEVSTNKKRRQKLSYISERESAIFTTPAELTRIRNSISKSTSNNDMNEIPFDRIISTEDIQRFTKSLILKLEKGYSPKLTNYTIKVDGVSFPKKYKKRNNGVVVFWVNIKNKNNSNSVIGTTLTDSTFVTYNTSSNNEELLDIELPFEINGFNDKFLFCIYSDPNLCQYKMKININNDYTDMPVLIESLALKLNYEIPYPIQSKMLLLLSKTKIQINPIINNIIEVNDLKSNKRYIINNLATSKATIGRDENCTVKINDEDDKDLSLIHLTLFYDVFEKKWFMKDGSELKESKRGTYFIGTESMELFTGMKIKIKGSVYSIKINK